MARSTIPQESMMTSPGFTPVFRGQYPTTAEARWQLIRKFLHAWCGVDIPFRISPAHDRSPSIQCWEQLCNYWTEHGIPEIRDCPECKPLSAFIDSPDTPEATVILQQGEGDVFWAVPDEQIREDDPPVDIYQIYDEDSAPFLERLASVSQFALAHLLLYNSFAKGTIEWFSADITPDEMERVYQWFDSVLEIRSKHKYVPRVALLESPSIVGIRNGGRLEVSVFCDPAELNMPQFLQDAMKEHVDLRKQFREKRGQV